MKHKLDFFDRNKNLITNGNEQELTNYDLNEQGVTDSDNSGDNVYSNLGTYSEDNYFKWNTAINSDDEIPQLLNRKELFNSSSDLDSNQDPQEQQNTGVSHMSARSCSNLCLQQAVRV